MSSIYYNGGNDNMMSIKNDDIDDIKQTKPSYFDVYKIVLLGEGMVGKTSLRKRFTESDFQRNYLMTIGVEVSTKNFKCKVNDKEIPVTFLIWDLGGQLYFLRVREQYYKGANGGLLVYDITNRKSFEVLDRWIEELLDARGQIPLLIVGNKIDLRKPNVEYVTYTEGLKRVEELKEKYNLTAIDFIETSALTGENVEEAFQKLGKMIISTSSIESII